MDAGPDGETKRLRIARGLALDEISLRRLAEEVMPGSTASLELVSADGRRVRIACGGNEADLRALLTSADADAARIDLVLSRGRPGTAPGVDNT